MSLNSVTSARLQATKSAPQLFHSPKVEKVTVPGIGVAAQHPDGVVEVIYQDGSRISVKQPQHGGGVTLTQATGHQYFYTAKDELPEQLRVRLTQMPIVVKHLMAHSMKMVPDLPGCLYTAVNKKAQQPSPQHQHQQQQQQIKYFR